jgi:DNA repair protein RadC
MVFAEDRTADILRGRRVGTIHNAADVYRVLGARAARERVEVAWILLLDTHGTYRGRREIARGAYDHVGLELPEALRPAVVAGCRYVILVHNHPSGSAVPSDADAQLTITVERAADAAGLFLLDHVVLGLNQYYSFRERGLFVIEKNGELVKVAA